MIFSSKLVIQKKEYNDGYNDALRKCIEILSDSIYQSGCPNMKDGLPQTFIIGGHFATCYGDESEYREKIYEITPKIAGLAK